MVLVALFKDHNYLTDFRVKLYLFSLFLLHLCMYIFKMSIVLYTFKWFVVCVHVGFHLKSHQSFVLQPHLKAVNFHLWINVSKTHWIQIFAAQNNYLFTLQWNDGMDWMGGWLVGVKMKSWLYCKCVCEWMLENIAVQSTFTEKLFFCSCCCLLLIYYYFVHHSLSTGDVIIYFPDEYTSLDWYIWRQHFFQSKTQYLFAKISPKNRKCVYEWNVWIHQSIGIILFCLSFFQSSKAA